MKCVINEKERALFTFRVLNSRGPGGLPAEDSWFVVDGRWVLWHAFDGLVTDEGPVQLTSGSPDMADSVSYMLQSVKP